MNEKILIVDDDTDLLKTLLKLLKKEGYDAAAVDNSSEALEKIRQEYFDIIILDVRMPGMDGLTALEKIRQMQGDSVQSNVIVCTAFASEDAPVKALKLGAMDYIMKPFDIKDFLKSVEQNLKLVRTVKNREQFFNEVVETNKKLEKEIGDLRKKNS